MNVRKNILIILLICSIAAAALSTAVLRQLSVAKAAYRANLNTQLEQYLQRHTALLQNLSKNLLPPLQKNDLAQVATILNAYEDAVFDLAKHDLSTPLSIQFVALDATQKIISSSALIGPSMLAPDDDYYWQAVEQPTRLTLSKIYVRTEMPDYQMLNFGIGVLGRNDHYYGHLDAKLALATLQKYLQARLGANPAWLRFEFNSQRGLQQPEIYVLKAAYALHLAKYLAWRFVLIIGLMASVYALYWFHAKYLHKARALASTLQRLNALQDEMLRLKTASAVQERYGALVQAGQHNTQIIELQHLLSDIQAVNAPLAAERGIQLNFPAANSKVLRFYGQPVRLMQILSGIVYEMLWQNTAGGHLDLTVTIQESSAGMQSLQFSFSDNSFYSELPDRAVDLSVADIRCRGWGNICHLLELAGASFEHRHTAYVGNTMVVTIVQRVVRNVISLESYLQDA